MKRIFIFLTLLIICIFSYAKVQAQGEQLTNKEIIAMSKAGLSSEIILQKISSSQTNFDISTDSLIELKKANISEKIIEAMLKSKFGISSIANKGGTGTNTASSRQFGIYLARDTNGDDLIQLMPNVSIQNRVGGKITAALVPLGFGKVKTKANLSGRRAKLQINNSRPVFYFFLDVESGGLNTQSGIPTSPREIYLIKFNLRKNEREIAITKENSYGVKGGLSDEYIVEFEFEDLGEGKFRVFPKKPLKPGEYGFYLPNSGNSNVSSGIGIKFFDFGVRRN